MTNKAERKKERRNEAEARNAIRSNRSNAEQLALIQGRRGNSLRETTRLSKHIMKENK